MQVMGVLLMLLAAAGSASAFQPPTRLVQHNIQLHYYDTTSTEQAHRGVVPLKAKESEDDSSPRLPFLARTLQKIRPKTGITADDEKESPGNEAEESSDASAAGAVLTSTDRGEGERADSKAALLRALAEKTRLEAERMDLSLTLTKIGKLEGRLLEKDAKRSDIIRDAQVLMTKTNAPNVKKNQGALAKEETAENVSPSDIVQKGEKSDVPEVQDGDKPLLSEEKRADAIDAYEKLPGQIKDMMARSVGLIDGTNATAAIGKLMERNRLFEGEEDEKFSMIVKDADVFLDADFMEVNNFVENMLPKVTRKEPVKMEYIDALYSEVLGKDTFIPKERNPKAVPGGYLIRGDSRVKSVEGRDDGDVLIEALDKKIAKTSAAGKIQVYYILDPTPPSGEEIMADEDEKPLLLVTSYDISPDTRPFVKPLVTFMGLASIVIFTLGSFAYNEDVMNRVTASVDSAEADSLDYLLSAYNPLAYSLLATQIVHELGHLIVAVKDGIKIGMPTLMPGFQFGLSGAITPIKESPKNIKSLFDFAIAGPLFGIVFSLCLLYTGLEMTAFMDTAAQQQLPTVPAEVLRSSALGGGIIDYLLGDGVLNSPDPSTTMIKLHPYAIAGFGGLVTNALALLPIGNTDGGRISVAFFGRSFSRVLQGAAILALVIAGFFGADEVNTLLCYAAVCNFWQREAEVPCRNEVDELDSVRGFVAIGMSLIVILALFPLPS